MVSLSQIYYLLLIEFFSITGMPNGNDIANVARILLTLLALLQTATNFLFVDNDSLQANEERDWPDASTVH